MGFWWWPGESETGGTVTWLELLLDFFPLVKDATDLPLQNGASLGRELTLRFEDTPLFDERTSIVPRSRSAANNLGKQPSLMRVFIGTEPSIKRQSLRASLFGAPPSEPTPEQEAARKREAEEMLERAMALYKVCGANPTAQPSSRHTVRSLHATPCATWRWRDTRCANGCVSGCASTASACRRPPPPPPPRLCSRERC